MSNNNDLKQKLQYNQVTDDDYIVNNKIQQSYRDTNIRWFALLLGVFVCFGSYYSFDNPQALQSYMTKSDSTSNSKSQIQIDGTQFNLLYSVYSFPNIILPFVGGYVIDKIGVRLCLIVFSSILVVGQFVFMLGCIQAKYWLMILGRIIFGLGGENLGVAQSVVISQWFQNKDLAFALGLNIAASRLGSALNSVLTPIFYQVEDSYFLPTFVGMIGCIFSVVIVIALCWLDRKADIQEGVTQNKKSIDENEQINLSDVLKFSLLFWLVCINCMVLYGAYFSFTANANDIQNTLFKIDTTTAGQFLTVIYLSAAGITPFFGKLVDKIGKRAIFLLISSSLFIVANLIFIFLPNDGLNQYVVLVPLLVMGLFYSTYAAVLWPCIPLCVEPQYVGTAFGIVNAIQNANLAVSPLIYGIIHDKASNGIDGYKNAEWFIIGQGILGLLMGVLINIQDSRGEGILNKVKKQKLSQLKSSRLSMHR